ncbi:hypothetical protein [Micromonospora sp. NPDC002717]|uniref:hypothetical protein n=1 Tax=Micromonospora sp. NPDC002717 TaxID=3154424 RepID=UPI00332F8224
MQRQVVLVDHAGESSSAPYGHVHGDDDGRVMVGWSLLSSLKWSVVVEVVHVLTDYGQRVPLVVDEQVVGALLAEAAAQRSMKQFARGAQGGVLIAVMPSATKTGQWRHALEVPPRGRQGVCEPVPTGALTLRAADPCICLQ